MADAAGVALGPVAAITDITVPDTAPYALTQSAAAYAPGASPRTTPVRPDWNGYHRRCA